MDKTRRHEGAIEVLKSRSEVRLCHLPTHVGIGTMDELVALGIAELVDPTIGRYAKGLAWRLRKGKR
jgi:hypothetical protein